MSKKKYANDLDESLVKKVDEVADKLGLLHYMDVRAVRLTKSKTTYGEVLKPNDLVKMFADSGDDDMVVIALYEDLILKFNDEEQMLLIETLLNQVSFDIDKGKVKLTKPDIQVSRGMYKRYGNKLCDVLEVAVTYLESINEKN